MMNVAKPISYARCRIGVRHDVFGWGMMNVVTFGI
jgi:hypothetical protein